MTRKQRNEFYVDVGFRLLQIRRLNNMTQAELGAHIGVAFQSVQRYESGEVPISTQALSRCAEVLNTPVGHFYGEDGIKPARTDTNKAGFAVAAEVMKLPNDTIRRRVYRLVKAINDYDEDQESRRGAG